jgi:outer membrane protein assembly factor BamB
MPDTQRDESTREMGSRRLRLWPAVVILLLQIIAFGLSISPGISNGVRFGFMILGPSAGVVLFSIWLLTASRLQWKHRLILAAAMIAFPLAIAPLLHPSIMLGLLLYGSPVSMLVSMVALRMTMTASEPRRMTTIALGLVTVWSPFLLGRIEGFRGDYLPEFSWRWTSTKEEHLVHSRQATPVEPSQAWKPVDVEWPGFRGCDRNGQAEWSGKQLDWTTSEPRERWRIPIGPGWSSFAFASGRLFTQEQRAENEAVSCYDAETGRLIWMQTNKARFVEIVSGAGPRATPTIAEGRLFTLGGTGVLQCLDPTNGEVLWKHDLPAEFNAPVLMWGCTSSPLLIAGRVVVFAGAKGDAGLVAFDAITGEEAWRVASPAGGMSYSSAQRIELAGRQQVIFGDAKGLFGVDPLAGNVIWRFRPTEWNGPAMCQPQQAGPASLIVPLGDGVGVARLNFQIDETDTWQIREAWTTNRLKPSFNDFVVHSGQIFGFDQHIFVSLNAATGERNWKRGRYGFGQAILLPATDQMIVVTEQGDLVLVAADPERHLEFGRFTALNGKTWNHPILVENRLFVRNGTVAVCYEL